MLITVLIYLFAAVGYVWVGYHVLWICDKHSTAMGALVGRSYLTEVLAWIVWPWIALATLFFWWAGRILRIHTDE